MLIGESGGWKDGGRVRGRQNGLGAQHHFKICIFILILIFMTVSWVS